MSKAQQSDAKFHFLIIALSTHRILCSTASNFRFLVTPPPKLHSSLYRSPLFRSHVAPLCKVQIPCYTTSQTPFLIIPFSTLQIPHCTALQSSDSLLHHLPNSIPYIPFSTLQILHCFEKFRSLVIPTLKLHSSLYHSPLWKSYVVPLCKVQIPCYTTSQTPFLIIPLSFLQIPHCATFQSSDSSLRRHESFRLPNWGVTECQRRDALDGVCQLLRHHNHRTVQIPANHWRRKSEAIFHRLIIW